LQLRDIVKLGLAAVNQGSQTRIYSSDSSPFSFMF